MTLYEVKLPVFQGPLDLLLHLIERQELDITQVSLAQVTDQYLAYLSSMEHVDPAALVEFLVIAARLLVIKSRVLLPQPQSSSEEEEEPDVGDELVRQLREYQQFKAVAQLLARRAAEGLHAYVRLSPGVKPIVQPDLGDVSLDDLLAAVQRALVIQPRSPLDESIVPFNISIHDKMDFIRQALTEKGRISFHHLLTAARSRLEVIVTFLAVLELMRQHEITVQQPGLFEDIVIVASAESRTVHVSAS